MRLWFSQVPVYPQRVIDLACIAFSGTGVVVAAVVAGLDLPAGEAGFWTWRFPLTFGLWLASGLTFLLVGRRLARRHGLPFVAARDSRALQSAAYGARPLSGYLLWNGLPSGILAGLFVAQLNSAHPFWQGGDLSWRIVGTSGIGAVVGGITGRLWHLRQR